MSEPVAVAVADGPPEADRDGLSGRWWCGTRRYALLDAWASRPELMAGLEAALIEQALRPAPQELPAFGRSDASDLLREFYRRYRGREDYERLCRQIGPQQGWPYQDLVNLDREQENWQQVLTWTEDGLAKLPTESRYRPVLEEARGEALMHLERPAEAVETLPRDQGDFLSALVKLSA